MTELYKFFEAGYQAAGGKGDEDDKLEAYLEWCDMNRGGKCLNCGVSSHKSELRLVMDEWLCVLCIPIDSIKAAAMVMKINMGEE